MPKVTFLPLGATVEVAPRTPLREAAQKAGVPVDLPCGGHGSCRRCHVEILSGETDYGIQDPSIHTEGRLTLLCMASIFNEDVVVKIPDGYHSEKGQFTSPKKDFAYIDPALLPVPDNLSVLAKRVALTVSQPRAGDGFSDWDRLCRTLAAKGIAGRAIAGPDIMAALPGVLRAMEGLVTVTYCDAEEGLLHIIEVEPGEVVEVYFGLAVDIGTTTLAVQLVDMRDGSVHFSQTDYNSQIPCGADVISRINYARKPEHLMELSVRVLYSINMITKELLGRAGRSPSSIRAVSLAGNTVMTHLLLKIPPEHIRLSPYTPALLTVPMFKADQLAISAHPNAPVFIAPAVGSYVGGDVLAGLLCTELSTDADDINLFIDIGTNGELVLGNRDFLMSCACSAGPAFEGGGIRHGMRAAQGAIDRVEVDPNTGLPATRVIGNVAPTGICGSGIISLVAALFTAGFLDAAGRFTREKKSPALLTDGKGMKYQMASSEESGTGQPLYLYETDVDNLIRAKGAIFSACRSMLKNIGLDFDVVKTIYIAGGFGRTLHIEDAQAIGLLPHLPQSQFQYVGNSSLVGAYCALLSAEHRQKLLQMAAKTTYIDLSSEPGYMDEYTSALFLPHTDKAALLH